MEELVVDWPSMLISLVCLLATLGQTASKSFAHVVQRGQHYVTLSGAGEAEAAPNAEALGPTARSAPDDVKPHPDRVQERLGPRLRPARGRDELP